MATTTAATTTRLQKLLDEQLGYYLGAEDYWTHDRNGALDWHYNDSAAETRDNGTYSSHILGAAWCARC